MTDQAPSATGSVEQEAKTSALDSSSIKLHETADAVDFEKFMLKEIFPAVNTQGSKFGDREVTPDQHFLLGGRSFDEYVWMMRLEYFIYHTPLPTWLGNRARESYASVKDKLEQFGMRTSTELLYDVKEWRQRLGIK